MPGRNVIIANMDAGNFKQYTFLQTLALDRLDEIEFFSHHGRHTPVSGLIEIEIIDRQLHIHTWWTLYFHQQSGLRQIFALQTYPSSAFRYQ